MQDVLNKRRLNDFWQSIDFSVQLLMRFRVDSKDQGMRRMWDLINPPPHSSLNANSEYLGVYIDYLLSRRVNVWRVCGPDRKSTFSVGFFFLMSSSLWNSATLPPQTDEQIAIVLSHSGGKDRIYDDINLETFTLILTCRVVGCQGNCLFFDFSLWVGLIRHFIAYILYAQCPHCHLSTKHLMGT